MGTTANYAWPYPASADAPNGAAQIQALADAADADVHDLRDRARCVLERNTAQSLANATANALTFPGTEITDPFSMHSTSSNSSRIVVPSGWAGWYMVFASVGFTANATGIRELWLRANGVGQSYFYTRQIAASGSSNSFLTTAGMVRLEDGEYVEALCEQNSGGSLDTANVTDGIHARLSACFLSAG